MAAAKSLGWICSRFFAGLEEAFCVGKANHQPAQTESLPSAQLVIKASIYQLHLLNAVPVSCGCRYISTDPVTPFTELTFLDTNPELNAYHQAHGDPTDLRGRQRVLVAQ